MNTKSLTDKLKALAVVIAAVCAYIAGFVSCSNEDSGGTKHDPSKPVVVTAIMPDTGRIAEMVILDGSNFGTDVSSIKVFFNEKEAKVIGSTGETILALVPRLPGDTCVVMVEIGGQKASAPKFFYYKIEANASTFAGNGSTNLVTTSLDQCQLRPVKIFADKEKNLFVTTSDNYLVRLNEEENSITVLASSQHGIAAHVQIDVNPETGQFMMGSAGTGNRDRFVFLDPKLGWTAKSYYIKEWKGESEVPVTDPDHYHCLYCKFDRKYYTYYFSNSWYEGSLVKINPETWTAEIVGKGPWKRVYAMAFHPNRPSELWMADDAGEIYTIDVDRPYATFKRVSSETGSGFRDGRLDQAMFNGVRQIVFDDDGNLYVGDSNNHCIRMINTETRKVETIIGIPQTAGFRDGNKADALFRSPHGIATDPDGIIYVSDYGNSRVRRIAIE
jgi:DNA-binding beta-propeller fold protein YncE